MKTSLLDAAAGDLVLVSNTEANTQKVVKIAAANETAVMVGGRSYERSTGRRSGQPKFTKVTISWLSAEQAAAHIAATEKARRKSMEKERQRAVGRAVLAQRAAVTTRAAATSETAARCAELAHRLFEVIVVPDTADLVAQFLEDYEALRKARDLFAQLPEGHS